MATVQIFTAARMQAIEDQAIVNARLDNGSGTDKNLVLIRNNDTEINVGNVRGPIGITPTVPDEINWNADGRLAGASPVGGAGVPPLKLLAGKALINTNTYGQEVVYFPGTDPDFLGISAVVCQVSQLDDLIFTHIYTGSGSPVGPTTRGVSIESVQAIVDSVTTSSFRVTLGVGGNLGAFGVPEAGIRLGGTTNLALSWMAFGW